MNLVKLTIDYGDGNDETMVVSKESNAYHNARLCGAKRLPNRGRTLPHSFREKRAEVALDWEIESRNAKQKATMPRSWKR